MNHSNHAQPRPLYPDMDNHLIPHDIQLDFIKDQAAVAQFDHSLFRYTETVE